MGRCEGVKWRHCRQAAGSEEEDGKAVGRGHESCFRSMRRRMIWASLSDRAPLQTLNRAE
jgi:hypothetical protein